MTRGRRLCWVAFFALSFVCVGSQRGRAEDTIPLDQHKCSLKVRHRRLRTVVSRLLEGTGVSARFQDNVPNVHITVRFVDLSIQQALRRIAREARKQVPNLTLSKDGDDFIIANRKSGRCFSPFGPEPPKDMPAVGVDGSLR